MISEIITSVKEAEKRAADIVEAAKSEASATLDNIQDELLRLQDESTKRIRDYEQLYKSRAMKREQEANERALTDASSEIDAIKKNASSKNEEIYKMLNSVLCGGK